MNIQILNKEESKVLKMFRSFPANAKKRIKKEIDKIIEEMEDEEDIRDAKNAMKEKSISAEDAYKQLGI